MDLGLRGRVAIVCAASQGLGRATAQGLFEEGANVVISSRDAGRLQAAAREIAGKASKNGARVVPIVADVTDAQQIKELVARTAKEFGRIDILVTNAGGPPVASFPDLDDAMWEKGISLNLMSTIRCIREVLPHMRKRRWGRIIAITSITAKQPINDLVISSTVRPGILGLMHVLSNQYASEGILVNSITPGFILTARQKEIADARAASKGITPEQYVADLVREVPVRRYGTPEELANVIVFLASERASFVTGATVSVDGGLTKGIL
ncbi:SDR family oxidoreductase [bacterium]|nr:MAG: SDR family oxidoreductase [bacterium]